MSMLPHKPTYSTPLSAARTEFQRAYRKAALQKALAAVTGEQTRLLDFDEMREKLKYSASTHLGSREIPLKAIVGSVGRSQDFTHSFLPANPQDEMRWASLRAHLAEGNPIPPIDVYQLGDAYFVIDGNHRVSIARQLGLVDIPAYVTVVKTRVPFSKQDTPEMVLCKQRYAEFLELTNLDSLRPGSNLLMTFCNEYELLLSQIEVQRYFLWRDTRVEYPYPEVVGEWYDHLYLPVIETARSFELPGLFPERTEADLFILMTEHRVELQKQLGAEVEGVQVAAHLAEQKNLPSFLPKVQSWIKKLFDR